MKKILSKEEVEKKEKRNKTILGVILVGIMVLSTAGYAFYKTGGGEEKNLEYNGLSFILQDDGFWHFIINSYEFATVYNPKDTENISSVLSLSIQNYSGKVLYFSNGSDLQAANEIAKNIGRFTERVQRACLEECEEDLPVKNCSDNIILMEEVNETLIKQEGNCVYVMAKGEDMIRVADGFIFEVLGIRK